MATRLYDLGALLRAASDRVSIWHAALALACVLLSALLTGVAPVALKLVVDRLAAGRWALAEAWTPSLLIAAYVLSQWLARSSAELRGLAHGCAEQRLYRRLSRQIFEHVIRLSYRYHQDHTTGALTQTLANGLRGVSLIAQHLVVSVLPVVIELLTVIAVLVHFRHAGFIVILCLSAAGYVLVFSRGVRQISDPARAVAAAHINATAVLSDTLLNYETVKHCAAERTVSGRYGRALKETELRWRIFLRQRATNGLFVATIFALSIAATMFYSSYSVAHGLMTVGDFVLLTTYALQLVRPLEMVGYAVRDITQSLGFIEKMVDLTREPPESRSVASSGARVGPAAVRFDRVAFSYRTQAPVLRNISFTVPPGRMLAIVGATGGGKSSILRLLTRLYDPDDGVIQVNGLPIAELPLEALRNSIAVVPQDSILFNDTIAFNIAVGRRGAGRSDVQHAARVAEVDAAIRALPDGYDTVVGERGVKLSSGERQRLSIARALIRRPQIVVFDEATSALDTHTECALLQNLARDLGECTRIVVAHRLSTIVDADEILVLKDGAVAERGTHARLIEQDGLYAAMWRAQLRGGAGLHAA